MLNRRRITNKYALQVLCEDNLFRKTKKRKQLLYLNIGMELYQLFHILNNLDFNPRFPDRVQCPLIVQMLRFICWF